MPDFQEYRSGDSVVKAHIVTDETAGPYVVQGQTGETFVGKGSVLIETSRPDIYDVVSAESFDKSGYTGGSDSTPVEPVVAPRHAAPDDTADDEDGV